MAETLEIDVHLIDGSVRRFRQADPAGQASILSRLHPERVFGEPYLVFGQPGQIVSMRQAAVLRIEVRGSLPADWKFGAGIESIDAEDGAAFVAALTDDAPERAPRTGERYEAHAEVREVGGGKVFVKVVGAIMPETIRVHRLERLMEAGAFLVRTPNGALLINLKNVVSLCVRPTFALPPSAIVADERREC